MDGIHPHAGRIDTDDDGVDPHNAGEGLGWALDRWLLRSNINVRLPRSIAPSRPETHGRTGFGPFGASASARLPKGQASGSERPGHHMLGLDEEDDPAGWLRVRTTGVERRDPVDDRPGRFTVD